MDSGDFEFLSSEFLLKAEQCWSSQLVKPQPFSYAVCFVLHYTAIFAYITQIPGIHTCDISLFRRQLPIFCPFLRISPYEYFQNFLYILYISLFGISDLPTKIQEFPSLFNHSPYLEKKISLFVFWDVSHVCWYLPRTVGQCKSKNTAHFHGYPLPCPGAGTAWLQMTGALDRQFTF